MHTFRDMGKTFEVGYWLQVDTGNEWQKLCIVSYQTQAICLVNFFNGGDQDVELVDELIKQEATKHGG